MILEQETFDKYGYKSTDLSLGSNKIILLSCDYCNNFLIKNFYRYNKERLIIQKDSCKFCRSTKQKEVFLKKYGVNNPAQIPSIIHRTRKPANIGDKFGLLTVIENTFYQPINADTYHYNYGSVKCRCVCGSEKIYALKRLRNGVIQSCGCIKTIHIQDNKKSRYSNKLYAIWSNMKTRCSNINTPRFKYWGGKGITVYHAWLDFDKFKEWSLSHGYVPGLSIDRIDSNKNYCPENCEWVTLSEQGRRVSSSRDDKIKKLTIEVERLKTLLLANNIQF